MSTPPHEPGPHGRTPHGERPDPYGRPPAHEQWARPEQARYGGHPDSGHHAGRPDPHQQGWQPTHPPNPYQRPADAYRHEASTETTHQWTARVDAGQWGDGPPPDASGQGGWDRHPGAGLPAPFVQQPRRNVGKIAAIAVIVLLILSGGVVGTYYLTRGGDAPQANAAGTSTPTTADQTTTTSSAPTTTAQVPLATEPTSDAGSGPGLADLAAAGKRYVAAINDRDEAGATELTCDGKNAGLSYTSLAPINGKVEVVGEPTVTAGIGRVDTKVAFTGGGGEPIILPIVFERNTDGWCVSL